MSNFIPSDECTEFGFFNKKEAEQLEVYPNV